MERYLEVAPAGSPPTAPAASPGYPTNGNPGASILASEPGEWWFHMMTEEMRAVIVAAGLTPSHATADQLLQALEALYSPVGYAMLAAAQTFTKAQRGAVVALTDGATITPDFALSNNYEVTLAGNRTLANPTNIVAGQSGVIKLAQDATGSRTLAFGSYWKFEGGSAPTLTTTASAIDDLVYYVESATRIVAQLKLDTK